MRFTKDEMEVALCLLELPKLIKVSESCFRFPFSWGVKRRRSSGGLTAGQRHVGAHSKSPPPLSVTPGHNGLNDTAPSLPSACEPESAADKIGSGSPATPLAISFSPSEHDDNPRPLKRKACAKKSKGELRVEVEELAELHVSLIRERDELRVERAQLKEVNSALKLMKLELTKGFISREQHPLAEARVIKSRPSCGSLAIKSGPVTQPVSGGLNIHQTTVIADQATSSKVVTGGGKYWPPNGSSVSPLQSCNVGGPSMAGGNAGPRRVPCFNASLGKPESATAWMPPPPPPPPSQVAEQRLSNKFRAAQARQVRMQICRIKKVGTKLRFSTR